MILFVLHSILFGGSVSVTIGSVLFVTEGIRLTEKKTKIMIEIALMCLSMIAVVVVTWCVCEIIWCIWGPIR